MCIHVYTLSLSLTHTHTHLHKLVMQPNIHAHHPLSLVIYLSHSLFYAEGTDLLDGSSVINDPFCDLDGSDPSGSISTDEDPSLKEISSEDCVFTLEEEVRFAIGF